MAGSGHKYKGEEQRENERETGRERESTSQAWRPVGQVAQVKRKRSQHSLLRHKEKRSREEVLPEVANCVNSVLYNETIYMYLYLCVSVPDILLRVKALLELRTEAVRRSVLHIYVRLNLHTH